MTITLEIPPDGPLFAGHFPGHPILPGVTELVLAVEAVAAARGLAPTMVALPFARLRQLVHPGDRLTIDAREITTGRLRLDLRRNGMTVANAEVMPGMPVAGDSPPSPRESGGWAPAALPPLDALIPHRPPMRFVTGIQRASADAIECDALVPPDCALVRDGTAPAIAAVEAAAQAAALWEATRRAGSGAEGADSGPRIGYLVAIRDAIFGAASIAAGQPFVVHARLDAVALPLTHYAIEATVAGRVVARGRIATVLATR